MTPTAISAPRSGAPLAASSCLKCKPARLPLPYLVNSVAISDDGSRVIAGTYFYKYYNVVEPMTTGFFGVYGIDWKTGTRLWQPDEFDGCQGVFAVAISGDGTVAAAGGMFANQPAYQGLLRAYDASTGKVLLDFTGIRGSNVRAQRVSWVSVSRDGGVLAAVADKVYVFVRQGTAFPKTPTAGVTFGDAFNQECLPTSVAVHPSGKWLVACDKGGNVCLVTLNNGQVSQIFRWTAPEVPIVRGDPTSQNGPVIFLSAATSKEGDYFVVGGNDYVYCFTLEQMMKHQAPISRYDTWDQAVPHPPADGSVAKSPPQNVRWVAISGDGKLISTVVNRYSGEQRTGSLVALKNADGNLAHAWEQPLEHNPNSTSIDDQGKFVVAADGNPFDTPGAFYCFDAGGAPRWVYPTSNMNWPIVISANGTAIAGGGDDGMLYSFIP